MKIQNGEILFDSVCLLLGFLVASCMVSLSGPGNQAEFFLTLFGFAILLVIKGPAFTRFMGLLLALLFLAGWIQQLHERRRFRDWAAKTFPEIGLQEKRITEQPH